MVKKWLILSMTMMAIPYIIPGFIVDSWQQALIAAAILGLINVFIKPIFVLLTLPLTVLTLGFFLLLVNPVMLMITDYFVPGLTIGGWGAAFWAGLIVTIINTYLSESTFDIKARR